MSDAPHPSDAALAAAIRDGDEAAFRTLYDRYAARIHAFVWYRAHSQELALDLTQEVFARVWKHRAVLDPGKSIKAYLYRIAHNLVINHLQRQTVEKNYLAELGSDRFITRPDDRFDLQEHLQRAIDALPERLKTVFLLHRFEGFSYAEIAASLEISIKTVEKRMSHALRQLRERLAPFHRGN